MLKLTELHESSNGKMRTELEKYTIFPKYSAFRIFNHNIIFNKDVLNENDIVKITFNSDKSFYFAIISEVTSTCIKLIEINNPIFPIKEELSIEEFITRNSPTYPKRKLEIYKKIID